MRPIPPHPATCPNSSGLWNSPTISVSSLNIPVTLLEAEPFLVGKSRSLVLLPDNSLSILPQSPSYEYFHQSRWYSPCKPSAGPDHYSSLHDFSFRYTATPCSHHLVDFHIQVGDPSFCPPASLFPGLPSSQHFPPLVTLRPCLNHSLFRISISGISLHPSPLFSALSNPPILPNHGDLPS